MPIHYGDATQEEVLHHADVENARAVVIVINDPAATRRITEAVRRMSLKAYILVRTRYTTEIGPSRAWEPMRSSPRSSRPPWRSSAVSWKSTFCPRMKSKSSYPRSEPTATRCSGAFPGFHAQWGTPAVSARCGDYVVSPGRGSGMSGEAFWRRRCAEIRVTLLAVNRGGQILSNPSAEVRFVAGDVLFVVGHPEKIKEIVEKWR